MQPESTKLLPGSQKGSMLTHVVQRASVRCNPPHAPKGSGGILPCDPRLLLCRQAPSQQREKPQKQRRGGQIATTTNRPDCTTQVGDVTKLTAAHAAVAFGHAQHYI